LAPEYGELLDQTPNHPTCDEAEPLSFGGSLSARKLTYWFLRLGNLDSGAFERLERHVPMAEGANALRAAVEEAEQKLGSESRRVHYLSVPPSAALAAVGLLAEANLVDRSRIIMEEPFGTDLASAVSLNAKLHEVSENQIFRIDHFLGKSPRGAGPTHVWAKIFVLGEGWINFDPTKRGTEGFQTDPGRVHT
jgi:Glucose-6-phosphate dehydrogenase, NAD binding domain